MTVERASKTIKSSSNNEDESDLKPQCLSLHSLLPPSLPGGGVRNHHHKQNNTPTQPLPAAPPPPNHTSAGSQKQTQSHRLNATGNFTSQDS